MQYNGWTADTVQHKQNHNNDSCYKYYMEIIVSVDKFATLFQNAIEHSIVKASHF